VVCVLALFGKAGFSISLPLFRVVVQLQENGASTIGFSMLVQ
jgi:hypothetical protein